METKPEDKLVPEGQRNGKAGEPSPKVPIPPKPSESAEEPKAPTEAGEIKRMRAFEAMVATEGWKLFVALLDSHIQSRAANMFGPVELANVLKAEHEKGTIFGLIFARDLVSASIAQTKIAVENARKFNS